MVTNTTDVKKLEIKLMSESIMASDFTQASEIFENVMDNLVAEHEEKIKQNLIAQFTSIDEEDEFSGEADPLVETKYPLSPDALIKKETPNTKWVNYFGTWLLVPKWAKAVGRRSWKDQHVYAFQRVPYMDLGGDMSWVDGGRTRKVASYSATGKIYDEQMIEVD